jgi:hypothetical protein
MRIPRQHGTVVVTGRMPCEAGASAMQISGSLAMSYLSGYGWRARIGIVLPSVNTVMEPWAQRTVPDGVSAHFARMFIPDLTTPQTLIEMDRSEGMAGIRHTQFWKP